MTTIVLNAKILRKTIAVQSKVGVPGQTGAAGPAGADGDDGLSAYQVALANGFVGTEAQWLASLVGAAGPQGIQGVQGPIGIQGPAGATGATGPQGQSGHSPVVIFGSGADADRITIDGVVSGPHLTGPQGPAGTTDHGALTGLADDGHTQYHTDARGDARYSPLGHSHAGAYDPAGTAAAAVSAHAAASDPHPGYLTPAEGNAAYEPINANIQSHIASTANPHAVTAAQAGADPAGTAAAAIAGHLAAADPHTQYHTDARGDARYTVQNGFEDRADSTLAFVNATRTLSITPVSGSFAVWSGGVRYVKAAPESVQIDDAEGVWHIYYDAAGALAKTQTFGSAIISDYAYVAGLYWDAANDVAILIGDERHGREMDSATHVYLHNTIKAQWSSGLSPANVVADGSGNNATSAQIGVTDGAIFDEDIKHDILGGSPQALTLPASIPFFYRSGAAGYWRKIAGTGFVTTTTGTGRAAYNQNTGATWRLTEVANNDFVLAHLFATNDILTPMIYIVGQSSYTTLANARTGADSELQALSLGGLSALLFEYVPIATFVLETSNGYGNAVKSRIRSLSDGSAFVDWRAAKGVSGASAGSAGQGVPVGGTTGQVLAKASAADYDTAWITPAAGGGTFQRGATFVNASGLSLPVNNVPVVIPIACTIAAVTVLTAGGPGSCVIDVWRDLYANYPPTVADSICGSSKPTISGGTKHQDATLTGWTTAIAAGDTIIFSLESVSGFTLVDITLTLEPT